MAGLVVVTSISVTVIGSALLGDENNSISDEREKVMKERKLQVPEFLKKSVNVATEFDKGVKSYHGGDKEPEIVGLTAEQVAEKVGDYYSYVHEVEKRVMVDEVKEESKAEYTCDSRPQEVEELSEPHKEKLIRYIKGMSAAEQMLALKCIPVEMCMTRISKEIAELKDFKSTINGAMSTLERKF